MGTTPPPHASQARSRKTRESILRAAVKVLTENGISGFTMAAVSQASGLSVGSIYRRFGGKDQLLAATQKQFTSEFMDQLSGKLTHFESSAAAPAEVIHHAVESLVGTFHDNGSALRVLLLLGLSDARIYAAGATASVAGGQEYARFIDQLAGDFAHEDRAAAIDFSYRLIYAACAHRLTQGEFLDSTRPLDWATLARNLAVTIESYLLRASSPD